MHSARNVQNHYADGGATHGRPREFFGCAACVVATVAVVVIIVLMLVRSCVMPERAVPPTFGPTSMAPAHPLLP
jgi:hypothetical protein